MPLRAGSIALSVLLTILFLVLALQSDAQTDSPSSGREQTLGEWLEKEIDWRAVGLHF
jgi:hypothetical protein